MAVLGSSIPIASFYCRRKDNFCCCGDITPKFGDFTTIPLPAPVAGTVFSADMRLYSNRIQVLGIFNCEKVYVVKLKLREDLCLIIFDIMIALVKTDM